MFKLLIFFGFLIFLPVMTEAQIVPAPDQYYGDLFRQVQLKRLFPDGKTFVDAVPKRKPAGYYVRL